ncbi:MAG TPA: efflux RND transporter periplasmic adaptor subunit [Holophagaceae bacterium]|nr:efflux RND transporter periplasmic adaptor subunit [Holophagaceae bacterium]
MSGMETMSQGGGTKKAGVMILVAAALGVGALAAMKRSGVNRDAAERKSDLEAGAYVRVKTVQMSDPERVLSLQGEALPYASTTLYAKISGYLGQVNVDRGDHVRAGQVLGTIQSPETQSDYASLAADAKNKLANFHRAEALSKDQLISQRELDQAKADADVAQSRLATQAAAEGYQLLKAPFDGVVTARYADPGALVQNAATGSSGALPIVTVARIDRLRVDIYLEQRFASLVKPGDVVAVSPADRPELSVPAKVSRTSGALDPKTRTMLTEVELDNRDGQFLPNSFVTVRMSLKAPRRLELPAEALVIRSGKPFAAVIDAGDRLAFRPVVLGEEDHQNYPVASGLQPGDRVALNLNGDSQEGDKVRPLDEKPAKPAGK